MSAGVRTRVRAAASSSARGTPSSTRQIPTTAARFASVSSNAGLAAQARSANSSHGGAVRARAIESGDAGSCVASGSDVVHALAAHAQHDAAGDEERGVGRDREQLHEDRRRAHELLEVVEHEQQPALVQRERQALLQLQAGGLADAERVPDRRQEQLGLEHVLERHEDGAVREERRRPPRRRRWRAGSCRCRPVRTGVTSRVLRSLEERDDVLDRRLAADDPREGRGHARFERIGGCRGRRSRARLVEALGEQGGEVVGDLLLELVGRVEGEVGGGVVGADAVDQLVQPVVAVSAMP